MFFSQYCQNYIFASIPQIYKNSYAKEKSEYFTAVENCKGWSVFLKA